MLLASKLTLPSCIVSVLVPVVVVVPATWVNWHPVESSKTPSDIAAVGVELKAWLQKTTPCSATSPVLLKFLISLYVVPAVLVAQALKAFGDAPTLDKL